jgi:transposase
MSEEVRLREPDRKRLILQTVDYETLIGAEHPARAIWRVPEALDLSRVWAPIQARENSPGRDASDPRMLLALWLYGLSEGVNSAREIARLSTEHAAYRWICAGVSINYHRLSDFRSGHGAALDELFTQVLGLLLDQHLITLYRVAQDGTRVRASAGGGGIVSAQGPAQGLRACGAHASGAAQRGGRAGSDPGQRAPARGRIARRARVRGALSARAGPSGEARRAQGRGQEPSAAHHRDPPLDHRPRGAGDEAGRWRVPPRLQPAVRHRYRKPHHCGRGRLQCRD